MPKLNVVKALNLALLQEMERDEDVLVIDSREHRTQAQNREAARARLIGLLQHAARRPKTRRPTKPSAGARERRIDAKKRRGSVKAARRRRDDE